MSEQTKGGLPVGVPDGWKLVPIKPDIEMVEAGHEAGLGQPDRGGHARVIEQYDAMLAAAPAQPAAQGEFGDAYQGAREDLAIWKRRALEAETKVRHQEQIIDHLTLEAQGETRFGEPSQPAAGSAVEEVDLFNEWFGREVWTDGCYGNPDILRRQLWPCWQARAALSAQQSAPELVSVPVDRIKVALEAVQSAMEDAYNNAYQNCCGRGNGQCCGNPEPAWSDADQAIMDALAPAQRELSALLASHGRGEANG